MGLPDDYQAVIEARAAEKRVRLWLRMAIAASLLILATGAAAFWGLL